MLSSDAVSYTHLDVYKRQGLCLTPDAEEAAMGIMETETSDGGTSSANTENKLLSDRPTENNATVSVSNECLISISEISPVPKPSTSKGRKSTHAKHHSEILTATPRKRILEELEVRKKKKLEKEESAKQNKSIQ